MSPNDYFLALCIPSTFTEHFWSFFSIYLSRKFEASSGPKNAWTTTDRIKYLSNRFYPNSMKAVDHAEKAQNDVLRARKSYQQRSMN